MKPKERQDRIKELDKEIEPLEPIVNKYHRLYSERSKLRTEEQEYQKQLRRDTIVSATDYIECDYPSMGYAGSNGSAKFESKEQAEELIKTLNDSSGYYYLYKLDYTESGCYDVVPDYETDRSNDTVYTATFVRSNE